MGERDKNRFVSFMNFAFGFVVAVGESVDDR